MSGNSRATIKAWSISTTVRNPERIPDFCSAVKAIEGKNWNSDSQLEFMYELIRLKFYEPQDMTDEQQEAFDNPDIEITSKQARQIFDRQGYEDPPMRGRTAIGPLRDIGVVRLEPKVRITPVGKALMNGDISLQDVLLNYCLKWEVPQPGHRLFSSDNGFNIRPFIGTLALISQVNRLWNNEGENPVGISREEFDVFIPTLIDFRKISETAENLIALRKKVRSKKSAAERLAAENHGFSSHLSQFVAGGTVTQIHRNNLRDFGDNVIRYFRQTGFIEFRGAGRYIDISPANSPQVAMLVDGRHFEPVGHSNQAEYLDYMSDLNSFTPPWAQPARLKEVKTFLRGVLKESGVSVEVKPSRTAEKVNLVRGEDSEIRALRSALVKARLGEVKAKSRERAFLEGLTYEYGNLLGRSYDGYLPKPVALEFNTFKTFVSLNDAISVKPNYPTGDDGEPLAAAPGGATDLLCEYSDFVLSVEVTLSRGNTQWVMEGQPVQRHLRKVEESFSKPAYALFLAPKLHEDTLETFWLANIHGYQGSAQRIVAFEIASWCQYLELSKDMLLSGRYNKGHLRKFLDSCLPNPRVHRNSLDWKLKTSTDQFLVGLT